ncbi:Probable PE family protein [Mycobacteroides abscessus]|nr:Probable PE family protein [Mycobacteroides abscessus]
MNLNVVPEGLTATSAAVEALTARLAAAHAAAAPVIGAVVPPAADPVSLQTAAGFSARGIEHSGVLPRPSRSWAGPDSVCRSPRPATPPGTCRPPRRT